MTQQIINLGAAPDDGQGDNLRTAFDKTNENFDQIWTAGPVGSNVQIAGNTIATLQVNQDLALSPNGTGNIRLNNNTIPGANNTWFLGSATNQWRGVYANSITVGNITVNDNLLVPGNATIGGNLTVEGDTIQIGNIVTDTKTIQLSNTAANGSQANGSGITVGANDNIATLLYNSTSNVWTTNIGITATGNVTAPYFVGNGALLTGITSYANANAVAYGQAGWAGNIIPSGNAVYNLGNATNQWNDLYVSNATIFMNNVPLSLTAGNVLTVNGEPVLVNDSNTSITTTGTITAGNIVTNNISSDDSSFVTIVDGLNVDGEVEAQGNITASYFVGDGSQLTGISGGITFEYAIGNFTANALPTTGTMQFTNRDGDVVVPDEGTKLWINATDGTGLNTGSTWQAMAQNSERGTITLQQAGNQTPYRVSNIGVYNTPETYRGYRAGVNQIWGDDPSINQIIITNAANPVFYNENFDLENDVFHATGLADATAVYMVNVYGSDDFAPLSQGQLWGFFTSFVNNVIYQNTDTETQDVTQIRTAFYTNFSNFYNSLNESDYDRNFRFASDPTYYGDVATDGDGDGTGAGLRVRLNVDYTYTIMGISVPGTGYQADDVIVVSGEDVGGASPANDITLTVSSVNGSGGITAVVINSGVAAYPWRNNSISDGGDDQYDTGNRINTNLAQSIIYAGGNVTAGTATFGTDSEYAVMYNNSVFCMAATGVDITDLYYSGNLGADGDGFLRWSGLRNTSSDIAVEYAYMDCELGTGDLEPQVGQTYQVGLDSGGINFDGFYSYFNDATNDWYFGSERDWRLESRQQLDVQSYGTLTLQTLIPNEAAGLTSPGITIRTDNGSGGNGQYNQQAGSGGEILIRAGDAGGSDAVPTLGNNGGAIAIIAGDATGNSFVGGGVLIEAGDGANGTGGNLTLRTGSGTVANGAIIIETNNLDGQKFWTFDATGNLTVPVNGNINSNDGDTVRFQSLDEGIVRSSLLLNPNYGLTRLDSWDSEDNQNFTASDWSSATYVTGGAGGEIAFVDAPNIINFINSIETSRVFLQVNSGTPVPYDGYSSGGNNITFSTTVAPATSPTTVTDFVIYYSIRSRIEMDYDEGELNITARNLDITIDGDQDVDIQSSDRIRIENSSTVNGITISTDVANAFRTWTFDVAGNLNLPQGGVVHETNIPYGGFSGKTIALVPQGGTSADQQLMVYPTAGADANHLHLTTGNLYNTELFLGNDDLYVKLANTGAVVINSNDGVGNTAQWTFGSGNALTLPGGTAVIDSSDDNIELRSNNNINMEAVGVVNVYTDNGNNQWQFGDDGALTFPDGANIVDGAFNGTASSTVSLNAFSPDGNTVSFQAQGNTSSAVISIFSNAGPVTSNWTFTTAPLDPSESILYIPNGGTISTPDATDGEGGKNIFIQAGASDPVTWNSNPGGELMLKGGYGSFGDGGGGPGGNVNIEGGASSDSHAGNVNITCGPNSWVFDYSGNVTIPGNINAVLSSPAPSLNGFDSVNAVTVNATGNITADNFIGNISITGNVTGTSANVDLVAGSYQWTFNNTGNLVLPGNTFAVNYANGTAVSLGGGGSYGDSNVVTLLSSFGSNTVSTTGNVTSGNLITGGRVVATGNIVTGGQLQSSAFTGGNISWSANNQTDFQGAIKVGGTGVIKSPSGASSITLNSNGANIPILGVTQTIVSTSTTTGALIVSGGAGIAGNVNIGGLGNITGNLTVNGTAGVVTPNLPAFRVVGTVSTTWGPNVTITGSEGAAVDYNQGSYYNNTTGTFTAPVAGLYQVNMSGRNAGNTTSYSQLVVVKNLSGANTVQTMVEFAANSTMNHAGASTVSKLAAGDTLNLRVAVGTLQFDVNNSWSVAFLG